MSRRIISKGEELCRGDCLMSKDRKSKLVFQEDGNLVIYSLSSTWTSETKGKDVTRLCMQEDGNLVMYNDHDQPKWHTSTHRTGCRTSSLTLTDEGQLRVEVNGSTPWTSDLNSGIQ